MKNMKMTRTSWVPSAISGQIDLMLKCEKTSWLSYVKQEKLNDLDISMQYNRDTLMKKHSDFNSIQICDLNPTEMSSHCHDSAERSYPFSL